MQPSSPNPAQSGPPPVQKNAMPCRVKMYMQCMQRVNCRSRNSTLPAMFSRAPSAVVVGRYGGCNANHNWRLHDFLPFECRNPTLCVPAFPATSPSLSPWFSQDVPAFRIRLLPHIITGPYRYLASIPLSLLAPALSSPALALPPPRSSRAPSISCFGDRNCHPSGDRSRRRAV